MAHARNLIREYVRAQLVTISGLENSVEIDSERIPEDLELPVALVQLGGESISQLGLGGALGRKNLRDLELLTDIYAIAVSESLLLAEGYAAQIEAKLTADPRFGGLIQNISLRAYTIDRSFEGKKPITRLRLTWAVTYFTNERDATVPA